MNGEGTARPLGLGMGTSRPMPLILFHTFAATTARRGAAAYERRKLAPQLPYPARFMGPGLASLGQAAARHSRQEPDPGLKLAAMGAAPALQEALHLPPRPAKG